MATIYGLTKEGFVKKPLNVIKSELEATYKIAYGNEFIVDAESPEGQIIGTVSNTISENWEALEQVYHQFNPNAATDTGLSQLVQLNGITRKQAQSTTVSGLVITGSAFTVIPVGSKVSDVDTTAVYSTVFEVTIPVSGTVNVDVAGDVTGPIIANAGKLTQIETPIPGWETVNNPVGGVTGSDLESDVDLRVRRHASVAKPSINQIDSIRAKLLDIDGVQSLSIDENTTNTTDGVTGTPPHSFQPVILHTVGVEDEIAQVIFENLSAGIDSFGTTAPFPSATDSEGILHEVQYTTPTNTVIYVEIFYTPLAGFPQTGEDLIREAIVDYAANSWSIGDDVIRTQLFSAINTVQGVSVNELFIGTGPSPTGESNILIDFDKIAQFLTININLTIGSPS